MEKIILKKMEKIILKKIKNNFEKNKNNFTIMGYYKVKKF